MGRERERERDDARKSNEARKSDGTKRVFRAKAKRSEKKRKSRVGEGAREGGEIEAVERRERKTEMEEVRQVGGVPAGTIRDVNQWLIRVALSHGGREGRLRWIPLN